MTVATLKALGISEAEISQGDLVVRSPVDGAILGKVRSDTPAEVDGKIAASLKAFHAWRDVPAPRRGELVRLFGEELRANKAALGRLVTLEAGKIVQEGLGEVQEMIDICDFAVGLSRQLYGLTIASERPGHRMMETWHPAGPCRRDQRLQLPGCRLGLECLPCVCLRGQRDLETVREDAADGARDAEALREGGGALW
jgi:aldehyde dehydrogenase (NAD+)